MGGSKVPYLGNKQLTSEDVFFLPKPEGQPSIFLKGTVWKLLSPTVECCGQRDSPEGNRQQRPCAPGAELDGHPLHHGRGRQVTGDEREETSPPEVIQMLGPGASASPEAGTRAFSS